MYRCLYAMLFCVCVLAVPVSAGVHVDESGEADREQRIERTFRMAEEGTLKLTVACEAGRSAHLRIYIYEESPRGGWREIDRLRVSTRNSMERTSAEFSLPEGPYKVVISARRVTYEVKIEDSEDE